MDLEHDCMMLREVMVSEVWRIKPGTVEKRDAWNSITETLLKIQSPKFKQLAILNCRVT